MIWIDVIRMKWRESIHGLLQARDGTQRVSLTGYPNELFDGNPKSKKLILYFALSFTRPEDDHNLAETPS